ncbi:MAG: class I SAM-dependent methyltransferase [Planctomycetota bacterium]
MNETLHRALDLAFSKREKLIAILHGEGTDAYRLFHGVNEGHPGITVDRYGELILSQAFYTPFSSVEQACIREAVAARFPAPLHFVFHDRSRKGPVHRSSDPLESATEEDLKPRTFQELGMTYTMRGRHPGQDPLLFLDLRAGRRYVLGNSKGLSVLNLFAYTCGVGVCAAAAGAKEVWNVDFAASSLDFGKENAKLNRLCLDNLHFIHEDVIPVIRQMAGLAVKGRGSRNRLFKKFEPRSYDLVFLDPPRWAKTPFGAIDLVRDYPSLFKPALLATREGGRLFCTNHEPAVKLEDWLDILRRCAVKVGRSLSAIEVVTPEGDFPSPDGRHPLKMALVKA